MNNTPDSLLNGAPLATVSDRMNVYDRLPRQLRAVLANAPISYDPRSVWKIWHARRRQGWRAKEVARHLSQLIAADIKALASHP